MVTELGRILRKIRIDNDEVLKNMADRFGVTASYLSAVENGKRPIPDSWEDTILNEYFLSDEQKQALHKAVIESTNSMTIDMTSARYENKEVIFAFARKAADIPEDKLREIKRILGGD